MSHVVNGMPLIKDLQCLEIAGLALGFILEKKSTYKWYGHHVGDYPLPKGYKKGDMGKCDYVLRLKDNPNAYEIGVIKSKTEPDSYDLLWDFYAGGYGLMNIIGLDGCNLRQEYSKAISMKHLLALQIQGFQVVENRLQNGDIVLTARR